MATLGPLSPPSRRPRTRSWPSSRITCRLGPRSIWLYFDDPEDPAYRRRRAACPASPPPAAPTPTGQARGGRHDRAPEPPDPQRPRLPMRALRHRTGSPISTWTNSSCPAPGGRHPGRAVPPTPRPAGWNRSRRCTTPPCPTTSSPPAQFRGALRDEHWPLRRADPWPLPGDPAEGHTSATPTAKVSSAPASPGARPRLHASFCKGRAWTRPTGTPSCSFCTSTRRTRHAWRRALPFRLDRGRLPVPPGLAGLPDRRDRCRNRHLLPADPNPDAREDRARQLHDRGLVTRRSWPAAEGAGAASRGLRLTVSPVHQHQRRAAEGGHDLGPLRARAPRFRPSRGPSPPANPRHPRPRISTCAWISRRFMWPWRS